jgi:putative NADH-flavin reductase
MVGAGNRTLLFEWLARRVAGRQPAAAQDRVAQERLVQASGLDWTLVKPPRLTDGAAHRSVTAGSALRVGLLSKISRTDVAAFILDAIERDHHLRARVFVRG